MEDIYEKLKRLAKESEQELKNMGFSEQLDKTDYITYNISKAKSRWGQCVSKRHINISQFLLELGTDTEIKKTIIHEIIHTFQDTIGHGEKWKMYANIVNNYGIYNITRVSSISKFMESKKVDCQNYLDKRYKITCKNCGATYYKSRLEQRVLDGYKRGSRKHSSCNGNSFRVEDLKNNKIIIE